MKQTDTLIVGQGIAGTLVAFLLYQNKIPFIIIDPQYKNTSSRIAAGMFTPVSGKRKTIHPLAAQQISYAVNIYKEMEKLLNVTLLHQDNIYQINQSKEEQEELAAKLAGTNFAKYIDTAQVTLPNLKQQYGAYGIKKSGWVNCKSMLDNFAQWLTQHNALIRAEFLYGDLQIRDATMKYQKMEFNNIVFCQGYRSDGNPFFLKENIIPCAGDILTIKYDHLITEQTIKKSGIYFIPVGNNIFRAGATYQWNNDSEQPDKAGKEFIETRLDAMLEKEYTTIDHHAAIRPTTQNRELIVQQHPEHKGMFMLNGLGTKGILNGPWGAWQVIKILCSRHGNKKNL